jgi:hypothetical protein
VISSCIKRYKAFNAYDQLPQSMNGKGMYFIFDIKVPDNDDIREDNLQIVSQLVSTKRSALEKYVPVSYGRRQKLNDVFLYAPTLLANAMTQHVNTCGGYRIAIRIPYR